MTTSLGKKVLRVGILTGIHNLDPLKAQDVDSLFTLRQIVEAPFATKAGTTDLEPALFDGPLEAEPGEPNTYSARVPDNIRFSDGEPLTAEQVASGLAHVSLVAEQAKVEARGDRVIFRLHSPNPRFDVTLSHPQCNIHRWQGRQLLGTGAYRIVKGSTAEEIRLERNPYFRGEAPIDEIVFRAYPLDDGAPSALLAAIEKGEVDYTNVLSRDAINRLSGVRKSILPGISTAMLFLNTTSPKLADRRVRQAIAHSIDRIEVARTSYSNALAFAAPSLLPRALGAADDGLSYDPDAAAALLAEPGVEKPEKLRVLMMWGPRPYLPKPQKYLDVIAEHLGRVGIAVETVPTTDSIDYMGRVIEGKVDMILSGWIADVMDPADYLEANLASSRVPSSENISHSNNCGRLDSAEMDRALAAYRAERTSGSLEEVMRVLSEEAPLVPLAYGPTTAVLSFRVKSFKPSPLSILPLCQLDL